MSTSLAVLAGVATTRAVASAVAKRRLRTRNPAPGEMIDVGGYRVHAVERGTGRPVIILSGLGDFSLGWSAVQAGLAREMAVLAYDRSGLGWSDASPDRGAGVEAAVAELDALTATMGFREPAILVGHSYGGMIARLYAHRYPERVAGLVLVDSAHEDQFTGAELEAAFRRMIRLGPPMYGVLGVAARLGLFAFAPRIVPGAGVHEVLGADLARSYRSAIAASPSHFFAAARELKSLPASHAAMRAADVNSFGDLPIAVLRHDNVTKPLGDSRLARLMEEAFAAAQERTAALSSRGTVAVAANAGHYIHLDRPDLVVAAVRKIAATADAEARPAVAA